VPVISTDTGSAIENQLKKEKQTASDNLFITDPLIIYINLLEFSYEYLHFKLSDLAPDVKIYDKETLFSIIDRRFQPKFRNEH